MSGTVAESAAESAIAVQFELPEGIASAVSQALTTA